jgi:hypothetical protein
MQILFLLSFRQSGQGEEQSGHGTEGAGTQNTQPVDVS